MAIILSTGEIDNCQHPSAEVEISPLAYDMLLDSTLVVGVNGYCKGRRKSGDYISELGGKTVLNGRIDNGVACWNCQGNCTHLTSRTI